MCSFHQCMPCSEKKLQGSSRRMLGIIILHKVMPQSIFSYNWYDIFDGYSRRTLHS